jgi:energy-coupling factor transport system substrate-specific component
VRHGDQSLATYLVTGESADGDPGSIERTILALRAGGLPVSTLVGRLQSKVRSNGSVSNQVNLTAFAVLALRAAGDVPAARTTAWLTRQEDADGGFNFAIRGAPSDIDDTAAALEALAGASPSRAVHFIESHENRDGGFPSDPGSSSNAQSTAWAIQGLIAAGVPVPSLSRALGYLRSLIAPDGHVRYSRTGDETPVWVTAEALMALDAKPLPLAAVIVKHSAPSVHSHAHASAHAHAARTKRAPHRPRPASKPSSAALGAIASAVGVAEALVLAPISA